jgi:NADH dehydrogenase [ubiquinone] 1 alpha subcomplex assembly factor 7
VTEKLTGKIARRIRTEGPLTLATYMAIALHDPVAGYYTKRVPIGPRGDFTTAPEISQIFGELIGLWCAELWRQMGRPDPVVLAELGPGSGQLMCDFLRAATAMPQFRRALRLHLVETSPILRAKQENQLAQAQPVWVERIEDLPDGPMLLVANEFLDALPIRQFVRGCEHWSERMLGLDPEDRFVFIDCPESPAATLLVPERLRNSEPGTVVEICPAALALASTLSGRFVRQRGAALFVDYGYSNGAPGPTLQAVQQHCHVSPLAAPGNTDLSAHVDFTALAEAARANGADIYGPTSQRQFLLVLGAELRLARLSARATPNQRQALEGGLRRLLDPAEMGDLFKVIAMVSSGLLPIGFDRSANE